MFSYIKSISTVLLMGVSLSFISTAVVIDEAAAERKGYLDRTWNW